LFCLNALLQTTNTKLLYFFILYLTVWDVEPVVTHQTSWLESTGVCGVQQNQAGESSVRKRYASGLTPNGRLNTFLISSYINTVKLLHIIAPWITTFFLLTTLVAVFPV